MAILETLAPTSGSTLVPPWGGQQEPRVRGVLQNRITALSGASVPGSVSDSFRPASAMRVELRPFNSGDITVVATASALSTDLTLTMSTSDVAALFNLDFLLCTETGEMLRVNGAPSGTTVPVLRGLQGHSGAAAISPGYHFVVPCGDVNDSGGSYATSRAEVFTDLPSPTSTPPALWPNPPGSERWFHWTTFVPVDYVQAPDGTLWLEVFQTKGLLGGSPPLAMEINRGSWRFGGARGNNGAFANNGIIGNLTKGSWTDFIVGVMLSPDANVGWVEVWLNRQVVIPKISVSTMDLQSDGVTPDPIYLKQGIYRHSDWAATHIIHHGPLTVATTSLDFGIASSPPVSESDIAGEYWGSSI